MLYPPVADLLKNVDSRYLLVNVVAHRARQIAVEAEALQETLTEKPVTLAIQEVADGKLSEMDVVFKDESACCVVMASEGYPKKYQTGFEIKAEKDENYELYIAGAKISDDGKLLTGGGRVLGVVSTDDTLKGAVEKAYESVKKVSFDNAFYRKDIGKRALLKTEE